MASLEERLARSVASEVSACPVAKAAGWVECLEAAVGLEVGGAASLMAGSGAAQEGLTEAVVEGQLAARVEMLGAATWPCALRTHRPPTRQSWPRA